MPIRQEDAERIGPRNFATHLETNDDIRAERLSAFLDDFSRDFAATRPLGPDAELVIRRISSGSPTTVIWEIIGQIGALYTLAQFADAAAQQIRTSLDLPWVRSLATLVEADGVTQVEELYLEGFAGKLVTVPVAREEMRAVQQLREVEETRDAPAMAEIPAAARGPVDISEFSEGNLSAALSRDRQIGKLPDDGLRPYKVVDVPPGAFFVWDAEDVYGSWQHRFDQMVAYEGEFRPDHDTRPNSLPQDAAFIDRTGRSFRVEFYSSAEPPMGQPVRIFAYEDRLMETTSHGLRIPIAFLVQLND